ncbi:MAG: DNA starvation/stationary phase protection protein [Bacilli bacterium]|nr:DNA starvation/stationary phase protection protein [Bacilli bacterium]
MNKNIDILNEYMSNLKVFNNNLYNMHFNIIGSSFGSIHKKLEEYYEKIDIMYDNIAERIKMLNGYPITSLKKIEDISSIKSMKSQDYTGTQVMEVLDNDFSFLKEYTNDLIAYFNNENDYYTINILNDNLMFFTKEQWMINSSLK